MNKKTNIDEIKKTAYELFKEHGFDQVSVADISKACGITKPTFYNYIATKEDILTAYYDDICNEIMIHFSKVYEEDTYLDQIHKFYDMIIDGSLYLGPKLIGKMLSLNLLNDKGSFSTRDKLTEIVILIIQKGQQSGEFKSQEPAKNLYDACNFTFLGMEYRWCVNDGDYPWRENFHKVANSILQI